MDNRKIQSFRIWAIMFIVAMGLILPFASASRADETSDNRIASILSSPLTLFQSIISKADGQRCPMYPSCSHYAAEAVQKHGKIIGWILAGDRLLRCGHDEIRRSPQILVHGSRLTYDPLEANTFWWRKPSRQ